MTKSKGRKWDGKSRVSNDLYRKRYNEIFIKTSYDEMQEQMIEDDKRFGAMKDRRKEVEDPFKKESDELDESYKQSIKNKKERDPFDLNVEEDKNKITDEELKKIEDRNGF